MDQNKEQLIAYALKVRAAVAAEALRVRLRRGFQRSDLAVPGLLSDEGIRLFELTKHSPRIDNLAILSRQLAVPVEVLVMAAIRRAGV